MFAEGPEGTVALTPLGATLASDQPGSVRDLGIMWMETHYEPFGQLIHTARTGEAAATHFYGEPFFNWLARDPARPESSSG